MGAVPGPSPFPAALITSAHSKKKKGTHPDHGLQWTLETEKSVGHSVRAIPIVPDVGLLGLSLGVLGEKQRSGPACGQTLTGETSYIGTHQDLDGEQTLPSIPGVNGELHGQAGRDARGVEAGATGPYLAGVVGRKHLDLEGA